MVAVHVLLVGAESKVINVDAYMILAMRKYLHQRWRSTSLNNLRQF